MYFINKIVRFFLIITITLTCGVVKAERMIVVPSSLSNMNFSIFSDDGAECVGVKFKSVDIKRGKKVLFFKVNVSRTVVIEELEINVFSEKISVNNIYELDKKMFSTSVEINNFTLNFIADKSTSKVSANLANTVLSNGIFALRLKDVIVQCTNKNIKLTSALLVFSKERIYLDSNGEILELLKFKNC